MNSLMLEQSDVFDTEILRSYIQRRPSIGSESLIGSYSKDSFSFKLNRTGLIYFVPKVSVQFDGENEVSIKQEFSTLDRAYQRFGFVTMLIVGGMFLILPILGITLDLIIEKKPPISDLSELGGALIIFMFLLSVFASIKFFIVFRENSWKLSTLKTVELLNLVGVKSIHSYDQTKVIRRRYSKT